MLATRIGPCGRSLPNRSEARPDVGTGVRLGNVPMTASKQPQPLAVSEGYYYIRQACSVKLNKRARPYGAFEGCCEHEELSQRNKSPVTYCSPAYQLHVLPCGECLRLFLPLHAQR
jgi:hypothetical protein